MPDHIYKHIQITGSSETSSDEAIRSAIGKASATIREIRWFKVIETRGHVIDGKIAHWQVTLDIGFTIDD
ncbi:MAG: dodecin family protein [Alphaproteobacteria bacterium]|nr:dodecin family protein [Alphaproteobacteria bacterium]